MIILKEEAINLKALVKILAKEAINLTYLDNKDEDEDNTSISYYVHSPTTSVHEITAPGVEEDMHPGNG